jgi:predicted RNA binding protein with dsRBD fold (UPF0201 family)
MPLQEVLGWVGSTNRVGVLTVRGVGVETTLHLRHGHVVECAASDPQVFLGQFLLFHGAITEEDLDRAMREHAMGGRRLGDVLLDIGAINRENMEEALIAKAEETVLGSFDHSNGWFAFDPDASSLPAPLGLDMTIRDVIARGVKRVEDAAVAAATLERPGSVLRKTAKRPSPKINSVWPLRNAYALVDGERAVEEIVLHMHGTRFHVIQRLYQLFREGFIELAARGETDPPPGLETAHGEAVASEVHGSPPLDAVRHPLSSDAIEGIIPIAVPREIARRLGTLSNVEKYVLTLCGGTRDLRSITSVAPLRTQAVVDTIRSLLDRGLLKASVTATDHA